MEQILEKSESKVWSDLGHVVQAHVDVFNSMNAINDGECIGQKDGYGNVIYLNVVNDTKCQFSVSHEIDDQDQGCPGL